MMCVCVARMLPPQAGRHMGCVQGLCMRSHFRELLSSSSTSSRVRCLCVATPVVAVFFRLGGRVLVCKNACPPKKKTVSLAVTPGLQLLHARAQYIGAYGAVHRAFTSRSA